MSEPYQIEYFPEDDELYWYEREKDPEFIASIAQAWEGMAQGKCLSHEELKKEFGME